MLVVLAVLNTACGGSADGGWTEVKFQSIDAFWPAKNLSEDYVVRSESDWEAVWQKHEPLTLPQTPRPDIDFTVNNVLGLTRGTGWSGCEGLFIKKVVEEQAQIRVEYLEETGPPTGAVCAAVVVAKTSFVQVPSSTKPVIFVRVAS